MNLIFISRESRGLLLHLRHPYEWMRLLIAALSFSPERVYQWMLSIIYYLYNINIEFKSSNEPTSIMCVCVYVWGPRRGHPYITRSRQDNADPCIHRSTMIARARHSGELIRSCYCVPKKKNIHTFVAIYCDHRFFGKCQDRCRWLVLYSRYISTARV